jgi:hypothetical protein
MTTAVASAPILPQLEGANLLNLMIVDDERAIREACRKLPNPWVSTPAWPTRPSIRTACSMPEASTWCCST